jgi:hypothetical protein
MPLLNTADMIYRGSQEVDKVYLGTVQVWPPLVTGWVGSAMVMGLFPIAVTGSGTREANAGGVMVNL